jgi:hypothetical protein
MLLDRLLSLYGSDANDTRRHLVLYVERASDGAWTTGDALLASDRTSEHLLTDIGESMRALKPTDDARWSTWNDAREQYRRAVEFRWALVDQSEGSIPTPLLVMVVALAGS